MTEHTSVYEGKSIRIIYDRKLCIHAGECGRGSKTLFDIHRDPWCSPDAVSSDEAMAVVSRCPTGALQFERKDGGPREALPTENVLTVSPNGPLYVWGELAIEGQQTIRTRVALCRCGASQNKPFCDRSHVEAKFQDAGPVGFSGKPLEHGGGVLKITPAKNGPLLLAGNFTVRAASGRDAFTGTKGALCRCGASQNKPFCDGSHTKIHFEG